MNSCYEPNQNRSTRFRPPLVGCVARDRQLALSLGGCYTDTYAAIAVQIYRSLAVAGHDRVLSDLFDRLAGEELEQLRLLGELITALGGEGIPRVGGRSSRWSVRCDGDRVCGMMAEAYTLEKRKNIDRYETLMSRTGDRVVRSVISKLLSGERRMLGIMSDFSKDNSCDQI